MASLKDIRDSWLKRKGLVYAFVVGMLVGPFVSSYLGVQVTSRTARADLHNGIIDLQASLCDARARMEVNASWPGVSRKTTSCPSAVVIL